MSEQVTDGVGPVPVTIYGRTYHLRGDEEGAYLEELATLVDSKMREVAEATGTADTLKVAILASLNLADDLMKDPSSGASRDSKEADKRLARMVTLIDNALAD